MECPASGPSVAEPRTSSVEPPPMSTTSTGEAGGVRRWRTAPSKVSAASSAPSTTSGSTPSRSRTPAVKTSALAASRVAEVAQNRIREGGTPWAAISAAYSSSAAKARPAPRRRGVRCGRGPGRGAPCASPAPRLGQLADQQLDRVGAAVDGRDGLGDGLGALLSHGRSGETQGPAAHQSPSASSTSSPSGLTPGPWASAWPASTCRHLTRSGIPPAEMPSISGTSWPWLRASSSRAAR